MKPSDHTVTKEMVSVSVLSVSQENIHICTEWIPNDVSSTKIRSV